MFVPNLKLKYKLDRKQNKIYLKWISLCSQHGNFTNEIFLCTWEPQPGRDVCRHNSPTFYISDVIYN